MSIERHRCEAEVHDERCNGWADSRDHFSPRALIRGLKLDKNLLKSEENLVWMNKYCHRLKDLHTPDVVFQAKRQLHGEFIGLGEHI